VQQLADRVAVITGAASGIGRALAERLAAEGMRLVLADIEADPLDEVRAGIARGGADVVARVTDVAIADEIDALRDLTIDSFGAAHLVVNNAGVSANGPVWQFTEDVWRWVLDVDLWSVIHAVRAFVPLLVEQNEGHVVNVASMQGLSATRGGGPYAVAKHGVVALSEVLFHDLRAAEADVGVTVVCPGAVQTRIYESERNRPAEMPAGDLRPSGNTGADIKAFLATGLAPDAVADQIVDAVRTGRFYVVTSPERVGDVVRRAEAIASGGDPPPPSRPR
jgi:NAD(P)-dependent dehydrogenase (short-subunit alcohol dehydrogenase family)